MATRVPVVTYLSNGNGEKAHVVQWSGLTNATSDDGTPVELFGSPDRSVQVTGTFGAGGSVRLQGSNDGSTYVALTDPQGNALNLTASSIEAITEITRYIRPLVTAGDGTTSLVVTVFARKSL